MRKEGGEGKEGESREVKEACRKKVEKEERSA